MKRFVLVTLLVSFVIAGVLYHFAADSPDGLEKTMERFEAEEGEHVAPSFFPDYEFPLLGTVAGKTVAALVELQLIEPATVAGLVGTALVFGIVLGVLRLLGRGRAKTSQTS